MGAINDWNCVVLCGLHYRGVSVQSLGQCFSTGKEDGTARPGYRGEELDLGLSTRDPVIHAHGRTT
jgi:hypothetical protein